MADNLKDLLAEYQAIRASWERGLEVEQKRQVLLKAVQELRQNFLRLELDHPGLGQDPWWIAFKQSLMDSYERARPEYPDLDQLKIGK